MVRFVRGRNQRGQIMANTGKPTFLPFPATLRLKSVPPLMLHQIPCEFVHQHLLRANEKKGHKWTWTSKHHQASHHQISSDVVKIIDTHWKTQSSVMFNVFLALYPLPVSPCELPSLPTKRPWCINDYQSLHLANLWMTRTCIKSFSWSSATWAAWTALKLWIAIH